MRFKLGDEIVICNYNNQAFLTKIILLDKKLCKVEIIKELETTENIFNLTIAQSLIKKDNFELVLQKTTELGVKGIIPLQAERSIIKIDDFTKKKERYSLIVKEASEQSERVSVPDIHNLAKIEEINYEDYDYVFLAYAREDKDNSLMKALKELNQNSKVLFLIGPEGGFSKQELEFLKDKAISVSLGNTILRSETASIYVASVFRFLMENK
jgi:16S rRNA (uracil1498-N3)-methyltransferase